MPIHRHLRRRLGRVLLAVGLATELAVLASLATYQVCHHCGWF